RKNKIKSSLQVFDNLMGISQPKIHKIRQAYRFYVFYCFFLPAFIHLYGNQFTTGFAECPGYPDGGMAGRGTYFQSRPVIVINNKVMQNLAILIGYIKV